MQFKIAYVGNVSLVCTVHCAMMQTMSSWGRWSGCWTSIWKWIGRGWDWWWCLQSCHHDQTGRGSDDQLRELRLGAGWRTLLQGQTRCQLWSVTKAICSWVSRWGISWRNQTSRRSCWRLADLVEAWRIASPSPPAPSPPSRMTRWCAAAAHI